MLLKASLIRDAKAGETTPPNLIHESEFFGGPERKSALNQLHCLLNADLAGNGHQNVNMIGHDNEVVNSNFLDRMADLRTSMKRFAMRSVWNNDLPPAVRVVTKNVRGQPVARFGSDGREGLDTAVAEALHPLQPSGHD
jgi:hypothetical protein